MDTASFVLKVNTKDTIKDLRNLEDLFISSNLIENHEIFSNKNKKVIGQFKIETLKNFWIDEFLCLRSKVYAFNCGYVSNNKLKAISKSQSQSNKIEECKKCLDGENDQKECENYILRSVSHGCIFKS